MKLKFFNSSKEVIRSQPRRKAEGGKNSDTRARLSVRLSEGSLEILRKALSKFNVKGKRSAKRANIINTLCERVLWSGRRERRKIGCLSVREGERKKRERKKTSEEGAYKRVIYGCGGGWDAW